MIADTHKNDNNGNGMHATEKLPDTRTGVYEYPPEFRKQIIALMLRPGWLSSYRSTVSSNYFPNEAERNIVNNILEHYEEFSRTLPTLADMKKDLPDHSDLLDDVFEMRKESLPKTQKEVIDWAKSNAIRLAMLACIDDFEAGDISKIRERMEEAIKVGSDALDNGYHLIKDVNLWMQGAMGENTISTPWPSMNKMIGGGLAGGELGLIMAPTNGYKTTALVNIGCHAAGIVNSKNVIHFTLEMSAQKVLKRYAARITNVMYNEDKHTINEYSGLLRDHSKTKLRGKILVKNFLTRQAGVLDLRDFIMRMQDSGFDPGLIIIDYPDLLKPKRHHKEKRLELQEIYEDCRALGGIFNIPIWGASQANRGSFGKKFIAMEDIAEDISKANTADVIAAVCQTDEEAKEHYARLYLAKVREGGEAKQEIELKVKYPALIERTHSMDDDGIKSDISEEEMAEFAPRNGKK